MTKRGAASSMSASHATAMSRYTGSMPCTPSAAGSKVVSSAVPRSADLYTYVGSTCTITGSCPVFSRAPSRAPYTMRSAVDFLPWVSTLFTSWVTSGEA